MPVAFFCYKLTACSHPNPNQHSTRSSSATATANQRHPHQTHHHHHHHQQPGDDDPTRMWTCTKCSYAYNPIWVGQCDICDSERTPASVQHPSLITLTNKEDAQQQQQQLRQYRLIQARRAAAASGQNPLEMMMANSIVDIPPMASFEQDLDDDDDDEDDVADDADDDNDEADDEDNVGGDRVDNDRTRRPAAVPLEWTCKKCTLVNSPAVKACIVCGGSKLRSVSACEDQTLRKGEFWSCVQCTLKNSLGTSVCSACKSARPAPPLIAGQQTNFRPYTSSPVQAHSKATTAAAQAYGNGQQHQQQQHQHSSNNNHSRGSGPQTASAAMASNNCLVVPPAARQMRSPSPSKNAERSGGSSGSASSGAIPKVSGIRCCG